VSGMSDKLVKEMLDEFDRGFPEKDIMFYAAVKIVEQLSILNENIEDLIEERKCRKSIKYPVKP